jgi:hypothetical protein
MYETTHGGTTQILYRTLPASHRSHIDPSYPIAQSTLDDICTGKDDKESISKPAFPSAPPHPFFSSDRSVFLISSCLPDFTRHILPVKSSFRTSFSCLTTALPSPHSLRVSPIHLYCSGATTNSFMILVSAPLEFISAKGADQCERKGREYSQRTQQRTFNIHITRRTSVRYVEFQGQVAAKGINNVSTYRKGRTCDASCGEIQLVG